MTEFIKRVLVEILDVEESTIDVMDADYDLTSVGLDSLKAIELIVYIEDEYNISISDDDLFIDNMSSIMAIENLIRKYL